MRRTQLVCSLSLIETLALSGCSVLFRAASASTPTPTAGPDRIFEPPPIVSPDQVAAATATAQASQGPIRPPTPTPTAVPTPRPVTVSAAELMMPASLFPLAGYPGVTDTPMDSRAFRRTFTADGSTARKNTWVVLDLNLLGTWNAEEWAKAEDCKWNGAETPLASGERPVRAVGDAAKACLFTFDDYSVHTLTTGVRNMGLFIQADSSPGAPFPLDTLAYIAELQLALVERAEPAGVTSTARQAPSVPNEVLRDSLFATFPGEPELVAFAKEEGETLRALAYAGEVQVVIPPDRWVTPEGFDSIAVAGGGRVIARLPNLGLYWVQVEAGTEAEFIDAIWEIGLWAYPSIAIRPLSPHGKVVDGIYPARLELETGRAQLDFHESPLCVASCSTVRPVYAKLPERRGEPFGTTTERRSAATHGSLVEYYRFGQQSASVEESLSVNLARTSGHVRMDVIHGNLRQVIEAGKDLPGVTVINLSLGPGDAGSAAENQIQRDIFVGNIQHALELAGVDDKVLLVLAAGNESSDATLSEGITTHPNWANMIQVGALDAQGQIAAYSNYSINEGEILYVPVTDEVAGSVCATSGSNCGLNGTSFGAPQIDFFLNEVMKQRPDLSPGQIKEVLFDPGLSPRREMLAPSYNSITPRTATVTVPVLSNPYGQAELQKALDIAKQKFGERTAFMAGSATREMQFLPLQNLPEGVPGTDYNYWFCAPAPSGPAYFCGVNATRNPIGGYTPYHFQYGTAGGFPPFALRLQSNGLLTGKLDKATAGRSYTFTVCALDMKADSVCQPVTLKVQALATPTPAPTATRGVPTATSTIMRTATSTPTPMRTATPTPVRITPTASISQFTCVAYDDGYILRKTEFSASGSVTGNVGDRVDIGIPNYSSMYISWTRMGSYTYVRERAPDDPETSTWSATGLSRSNVGVNQANYNHEMFVRVTWYGAAVTTRATATCVRAPYQGD